MLLRKRFKMKIWSKLKNVFNLQAGGFFNRKPDLTVDEVQAAMFNHPSFKNLGQFQKLQFKTELFDSIFRGGKVDSDMLLKPEVYEAEIANAFRYVHESAGYTELEAEQQYPDSYMSGVVRDVVRYANEYEYDRDTIKWQAVGFRGIQTTMNDHVEYYNQHKERDAMDVQLEDVLGDAGVNLPRKANDNAEEKVSSGFFGRIPHFSFF